jgi:hypothetical protein
MTGILGGADRVHTPNDQRNLRADREARQNEPWGRIIFLSRITLWPQQDEPRSWKNVAWLVSVQFNDFRAPGYDVGIPVAAAHEEVYRQLDNYAPDVELVQVAMPIWRFSTPYPEPVYDEERKLWLNNAEYRTQVVPRVVIES